MSKEGNSGGSELLQKQLFQSQRADPSLLGVDKLLVIGFKWAELLSEVGKACRRSQISDLPRAAQDTNPNQRIRDLRLGRQVLYVRG